MNIGTMNIDNLVETMTEDEAIELTELLARRFDWKGAYFYAQDIESRLKALSKNGVPVTVEEVVKTTVWSIELASSLISEGYELLDEAIFEAEEKKMRGIN